MAKTKSRRATKKPPKKQMKLDTVFKCPFCDQPDGVKCIIDKEYWIGKAICVVCKETYDNTITDLTEPIEIWKYHECIDECVRANYNSGDDAPREKS